MAILRFFFQQMKLFFIFIVNENSNIDNKVIFHI